MDDAVVRYQNQLVEFFTKTRQITWDRGYIVRKLEKEYDSFVLEMQIGGERGQEPEATISTAKGYTGFVHYQDPAGVYRTLEVKDGLVLTNEVSS